MAAFELALVLPLPPLLPESLPFADTLLLELVVADTVVVECALV
jgi:hypothetical protein